MKLKAIAENHNFLLKALEWVVLIFICSMTLIGIWSLIWGGRSDIGAMKWLQFFQSLGVFLLPALIVAYLWSDKPADYLHLSSAPKLTDSLFAVVIIIVGLPAINMLSYFNQQLTLPSFLHDLELQLKQWEEAAEQLTERFLQTDNLFGLIVNLLLMALLPALCEETCFRGILQNLFGGNDLSAGLTRKQHMAVWATACVFSFVHFQFYGFLPRLLLGALLGYLLVLTGCLWVPIIAHFTNNACSVIAYYIVSNNENIDMEQIDSLGAESTLWLGILSVGLVILFIFLFVKSKNHETN